jgi:hypothetical protein
MTTLSRKAPLTTAICAAGITGLSAIGSLAAIGPASAGRRLAAAAALPAIPGQIAAAFLGLGHGAHGFPSHRDVEPYILTFFLWWGILYLVVRRRARPRATNP